MYKVYYMLSSLYGYVTKFYKAYRTQDQADDAVAYLQSTGVGAWYEYKGGDL